MKHVQKPFAVVLVKFDVTKKPEKLLIAHSIVNMHFLLHHEFMDAFSRYQANNVSGNMLIGFKLSVR